MTDAPQFSEDELPDELEDDLDSDPEDEESESDSSTFIFTKSDWNMVSSAKNLLWKAVRSSIVSPPQLVGLGRALYALEQLPNVIENLCVSVTIGTPTQFYDEREIRRYWEVRFNENEFDITSGGHHHDPSVGGDSFTVFSWNAFAGEETTTYDYRDKLWMIPDLADFSTESNRIDLSEEGWRIYVEDDSEDIEMDTNCLERDLPQ